MLFRSALLLSMLVGICGIASAQIQPQMQGQGQPMASEGAETLQSFLASCIALGNHGEIVLGQLAEDQAKNDRVKDFAKSMVRDHRQANTGLLGLIPPMVAQIVQSDQAGRMARRTDPPPQMRTTMRPGEGASQLLQIEVQAAKNCAHLTKSELAQKQGAAFDKAYMGQQICAHTDMLTKLQAMEPFVTGQFKQDVQQAIQGTQKHLDEAKNICNDLER